MIKFAVATRVCGFDLHIQNADMLLPTVHDPHLGFDHHLHEHVQLTRCIVCIYTVEVPPYDVGTALATLHNPAADSRTLLLAYRASTQSINFSTHKPNEKRTHFTVCIRNDKAFVHFSHPRTVSVNLPQRISSTSTRPLFVVTLRLGQGFVSCLS